MTLILLETIQRIDQYHALLLQSIHPLKNGLEGWLQSLPPVSQEITRYHLREFSEGFLQSLTTTWSGVKMTRRHFREALISLKRSRNFLPLLVFLSRYPSAAQFLGKYLWELEHVYEMWASSKMAASASTACNPGGCVEDDSILVFKTFLLSASKNQIGQLGQLGEADGTTSDTSDSDNDSDNDNDNDSDKAGDRCNTVVHDARRYEMLSLIRKFEIRFAEICSEMDREIGSGEERVVFYGVLDTWCAALGFILSEFISDARLSIESKTSAQIPRILFKDKLYDLTKLISPLLDRVIGTLNLNVMHTP